MARAYTTTQIGRNVHHKTGRRYELILSDAQSRKPMATCTQADLEQEIKDKGIVAGETRVRFPANGPVRLVVKILPGSSLMLEGFEHPVSPRGVRVV